MQKLIKSLKKTKGQSLAEYGLILALIAIVAIAGLTQLGQSVNGNLNGVSGVLNSSAPGTAGTYTQGGGG
jgi:pilus assembly protein Flp/PilA